MDAIRAPLIFDGWRFHYYTAFHICAPTHRAGADTFCARAVPIRASPGVSMGSGAPSRLTWRSLLCGVCSAACRALHLCEFPLSTGVGIDRYLISDCIDPLSRTASHSNYMRSDPRPEACCCWDVAPFCRCAWLVCLSPCLLGLSSSFSPLFIVIITVMKFLLISPHRRALIGRFIHGAMRLVAPRTDLAAESRPRVPLTPAGHFALKKHSVL